MHLSTRKQKSSLKGLSLIEEAKDIAKLKRKEKFPIKELQQLENRILGSHAELSQSLLECQQIAPNKEKRKKYLLQEKEQFLAATYVFRSFNKASM